MNFYFALVSVLVVLVEATLAYFDGMFLPSQMVLVRKYPVGLPFVAHGGMWGDLFLISPFVYMIGKYRNEGSFTAMLCMFAIGLISSGAMHGFVYTQGELPDSLASARQGLTPAGWFHLFYFGAVVGLLLLFYFWSKPVGEDLMIVSVFLTIHLLLGNHVGLKLVNSRFHFPWCPPFSTSSFVTVMVGDVLLVGATTYAGGIWTAEIVLLFSIAEIVLITRIW